MENLLFFGLGFISYKLVKLIYINAVLYIAFRKRRAKWCHRANFENRLKYDKRLVR